MYPFGHGKVSERSPPTDDAPENVAMTRIWLAAAAALTSIAGLMRTTQSKIALRPVVSASLRHAPTTLARHLNRG
jgi:hypothetical protein